MVGDVLLERVQAAVDALLRGVHQTVDHGPEGRVVLGVLGGEHQLLDGQVDVLERPVDANGQSGLGQRLGDGLGQLKPRHRLVELSL